MGPPAIPVTGSSGAPMWSTPTPQHPEAAWELVQALTTAEVQGQIAALGANVPSRVSQEALDAFLTFTPPANNQAFLNGLANSPTAEGPLWAGSWPEFATVMDAAVSSLLTGETSVDDFAASVCDEANKAFDAEAPAAAAPSTETMEEVTIRWRTRPDNQEEADVYQGISDSLTNSLDGITLEYEPGGSETASYQDVLKTELASGTAPDVFWIPGTDVADFATRGLLYDMRGLAYATAGYSDTDFYAGPMFHLAFDPDTSSSGGVLWGLPRDVSTFALYLNLDLIFESGADDPRELEAAGEWDWDAFLEVSEAVAALGSDVQGYGGSAWWGPYGVWMNAAGGGFFNEDRTACNLDSAESLAGLTFAQQLYQDSGSAVPYGEDANRRSAPVTWACSRTAVGPPPVSAPSTSNGTSSDCPMGPPAIPVTGSSGAPTWSTPIPNIPKQPGNWCKP